MIFLFYIKRRIKPNINYLKNKLVESKIINEEDNFDIITLKQMLKNRFETVNFNQVRSDAENLYLTMRIYHIIQKICLWK